MRNVHRRLWQETWRLLGGNSGFGMPHFSMGHGISCDCGVTMLPYHVNRLVTTNGKQIPTNTSSAKLKLINKQTHFCNYISSTPK